MPSTTRSAARRAPADEERRLDRLFHALTSSTRRAMLARLSLGPATVGQLAAPFAMSLPAVSKHLRVLENARLLERDVRGRVHHCSLRPEALQSVERWLTTYRAFWSGSLESLARHLEIDADDGEP